MSQNIPSNNTTHTLKNILRVAAKPLFFILFLILVCSFLAHYLTDSETLEEYARNNPKSPYENNMQTSPNTDEPDTSGKAESISGSQNTTVGHNETTEKSNTDVQTSSDDAPATDYNNENHAASNSEPDTDTEPIATDKSSAYNMQESTVQEDNLMEANAERTTYQPGFYYEPLSESIKEKITGISYPETGCTVPYEDLNYVGLLYIDFNGDKQTGELICHKEIAQDMVEIFYELYQNQYQIERIRLIDEYSGDDTASMSDNNTSCFNYRVVDGTTSLSKHALGCAIDINPFYNPYVVFNKDGSGETYISPKGSEIYADRSVDFPYKIDENDLCYKLFTEHGFTWGGHWNSCKDYQHFQIVF